MIVSVGVLYMEVGKVANMVADVRHIGRTADVPELNWPQSGNNHR